MLTPAFITAFVPPDLGIVIAALILLVTVVVHVALALGVWSDALRYVLDEKRVLSFMPSWGWTLATLLTGLLGATCYWIIHRSTLRRD